MNELGDHSLSEEISDSAYKLSLCKKGNSGYSFGPCQWDLSNPNRKITSSIKIIDLNKDIISKIIKVKLSKEVELDLDNYVNTLFLRRK